MDINVPDFAQNFTSNGDATGYATVTDNSGFYVGCLAYLSNSMPLNERCVITQLVGTTGVGLRIVADDNENQKPSYGNRSDLSAYTTALGARLNMPAQLAKIEKPWARPLGTV